MLGRAPEQTAAGGLAAHVSQHHEVLLVSPVMDQIWVCLRQPALSV